MGSSPTTVPPSREGSASSASNDEPATIRLPAGRPHPPLAHDVPAGTALGRYVVIDELGRGGMGRVLRAYDPKLRREVALKDLHREAVDEEVAARMVVEAQAMAKLSHPHVVAIYDVEELGPRRAVLAMELVRGPTLGAWLEAKERSWSEVLAMVVQAGRGLAAAHAAGLLHRDFKPANVLVSEGGTAKVMDFGLAKEDGTSPSSWGAARTADEPTEELTAAGTVMGTPRYMAPEQHLAEPLSPATDQYAFCVTAWELLCGTPPFSGATLEELVDRKLGPLPVWPRVEVPRAMVDAIKRGLSHAPERRWPSMDALLSVLARDPRQRRARWLLVLAGAGVLGTGSVSARAWSQHRAQPCTGSEQQLSGIWDKTRRTEIRTAMLETGASYAEVAWTRTQEELDAYATSWAEMHAEACEATTVREEQSARVMDLRMACLHGAQVDLRAAVRTLAEMDAKMLQNVHRLTGGLPPLDRCADVEALEAELQPPLPSELATVEEIRERLSETETERLAGRYQRSQATLLQAEERAKTVVYGPVHAEVSLRRALLLEAVGEYAGAEQAGVDALMVGARWEQWPLAADASLMLLHLVGARAGRTNEGLSYGRIAEALVRGDSRREGALASHLGAVQMAAGSFAEAEEQFRIAIGRLEGSVGRVHPDTAITYNNLATALGAQGKLEEATVALTEAVSLMTTTLGSEHPHLAGARINLAHMHFAAGSLAEAEAESRAAVDLWQKTAGPDHPGTAAAHLGLGSALAEQGKHAQAEPEYRLALAVQEKTMGPDHVMVAQGRYALANALVGQGRHDEALPLAQQAWDRLRRDDAPTDLHAYAQLSLARALAGDGRPTPELERARALAQEALELLAAAGANEEELEREQAWLDSLSAASETPPEASAR